MMVLTGDAASSRPAARHLHRLDRYALQTSGFTDVVLLAPLQLPSRDDRRAMLLRVARTARQDPAAGIAHISRKRYQIAAKTHFFEPHQTAWAYHRLSEKAAEMKVTAMRRACARQWPGEHLPRKPSHAAADMQQSRIITQTGCGQLERPGNAGHAPQAVMRPPITPPASHTDPGCGHRSHLPRRPRHPSAHGPRGCDIRQSAEPDEQPREGGTASRHRSVTNRCTTMSG